MTIEELKQCDGFTVQVTIDGDNALATIETRMSPDGQPQLAWPISPGEWEDVLLLPISEEDAASFRLNGNEIIYSAIKLSTKGGKHRL